MKVQKFNRGNLVRILTGHEINSNEGIIDLSPDDIGKEAIIEYSYADRYGGSDVTNYSVIFCDNGSSMSWKNESELEFINDGGEYLIEQAKIKRGEVSKQNKDIKYILSKIDEGDLNSESILYLFDLIGFQTRFKKNGEYFVLFNDWKRLHPAFVHIKNSNSIDEAESIFLLEVISKLNIEKVYNIFKENLY